MNHVFLSGIVATAPDMVSGVEKTPHAVMKLAVSHRTAAGVEKKEEYPVSAWRGIARRMVELVKPGSHVSIKGYLSQKQTNEGIFLEVTAEEFQVSARSSIVRPMRGNAAPLHFPAVLCPAKQEPALEAKPETGAVPDFSAQANTPEVDQ